MQLDSLCDRCQSLENIIEEFEKPIPLVDRKPDGVDRSHQEIIPSDSLDHTCRLCLQLISLFRACAQGARAGNINAEGHELLFKCRYWWHPDLTRLVAYYRISYRGRLSFVFLRLHSTLPLAIVDRSQADYRRLRNWFRDCKTHHNYCKLHDHTSPAPQVALKAIDCTTRVIRLLPPHSDYICLSYVWGSSKANSGRPLHDLPKTIEDAIYVTLQLGIKFLWVDRYCIDQDNPDEKHHMINNMDQIYLNATFTIIAAEGDGPHAGLPGVCGTPRRPQRVVRIKQLTLIGIESVSRYVQDSKWNSRGWTYQEMLLSRRILLFTDTRIYYQCLSGFGLEGVTRTIRHRRRERSSNNSTWTEKVPGTKPVFPILQGDLLGNTILDRLSDYFERSLSFSTDTIRAVLGIFNALRVTESFYLNHFYGMPVVLHRAIPKTVTEDFVERLTWVAGTNRPADTGPNLGDDYGLPNTNLSNVMPGAELNQRSRLFPSWSWAAFKADCPERERTKGLKLIFPTSHKQVDTKRCFDAADTEIRICRRRSKIPVRLSNFVRLHQDYENYYPQIDVTAWTWNAIFSVGMLGERIDAYSISLHFDDSRTSAENRLTAIHTVTYKTRYLHEEELPHIHANGTGQGEKLRRVSSNPHERSYHSRMLLVKRNGFQTYTRVGILTLDTIWRSDTAPGSVEDVLKSMMKPVAGEPSEWRRKTLRLV
ncbi:heterokaryon incompatibility protein-domain-containing protein [Boeremia exigua]|uniref:heterokaryon incompatibility protein-domain-containing protein n=1 Tax=Boeremia exigua TaxID=749465 RepID=UPI001E8E8BD7|nr:heterokaryon incompatibility protein-domain-containing protein [Boeremia exigua]KAH6622111.1 heterokaryon incompatibility protein-domain-containing protein [Boeremia exigua]